MTQYVLSPRAQADLEDIWAFTTRRWGQIFTLRYPIDAQMPVGRQKVKAMST